MDLTIFSELLKDIRVSIHFS